MSEPNKSADEYTPQEFLDLASRSKIQLLDELAAQMMYAGYQAAMATAEHHRVKLTDKDNPRLPELTAARAMWEGKYDTLKHVVSALQSTLKADRVGMAGME